MTESPPRRQRIVLCMGQHCNRDGRATPFYERLRSLLGMPGLLGTPVNGLKWETANCLSRCEDGPNLVLYPSGEWRHTLDEAAMEAFIYEVILPLIEDSGT